MTSVVVGSLPESPIAARHFKRGVVGSKNPGENAAHTAQKKSRADRRAVSFAFISSFVKVMHCAKKCLKGCSQAWL